MRRLDDSVIYGQRDKKSAPTRNEGFDCIQQMPDGFIILVTPVTLLAKLIVQVSADWKQN